MDKTLSNRFLQHIYQAKKGQSSDLQFTKVPLCTLQEPKHLQIIYIGASHVESTEIKYRYNKPYLYNLRSQPLKPFKSSKQLFELIESLLATHTQYLYLSIAANLKTKLVREGKDGKSSLHSSLIQNHRVHNLADLVGKDIAQKTKEYLKSKHRKLHITALNNLTSLAYLSRASHKVGKQSTIFGVVASGINLGFIDQKNHFVNLESGKFRVGAKEVSELAGEAFLYKNFNQLAKQKGLKATLNCSKDFRQLLNKKNPHKPTSSYQLAKEILNRSAYLVACQLAAILKYKLKQNSGQNKFGIVIEGSLFWEVRGYLQQVQKSLQKLGISKSLFYFVRIRQGFILGILQAITPRQPQESKPIFGLQAIHKALTILAFSLRGPPFGWKWSKNFFGLQ